MKINNNSDHLTDEATETPRAKFLPRTEALYSDFIACPPTPRQILEAFNDLELELSAKDELVEQMRVAVMSHRSSAYICCTPHCVCRRLAEMLEAKGGK